MTKQTASAKVSSQATPKVGLVSLGCPKALVDSERILTQLRADGYSLSGQYDDADVVIVNTCGFLDSAKAESLSAIGEAMAANGRVIVTGCMGKDNAVLEQFPDVLAVSGPQAYEDVVSAVREHAPIKTNRFTELVPQKPEQIEGPGVKLTPRHYAYLKISEGCNNRCSFCIIPSLRGDLVSRPIHEVLYEAERLVRAGVKEILVISQDTSAYGVDLKYAEHKWKDQLWRTKFYDLAKALSSLGVWIRMHYVYPYPHVDEVVGLMAEGRILPYLDIPFQHASPNVLKAMRRPANFERVAERIKNWRKMAPDLTLRSTFIVGFPGETEEDVDFLLDWLDEVELDRVGCFKYEAVDGAKANDLPGAVPEEVKEERWHRFMQRQNAISRRRLKSKVGRTLSVIVDGVEADRIVARSMGDAPEIDGNVFLDVSGKAPQVGDIVSARITRADDYDLFGKLA